MTDQSQVSHKQSRQQLRALTREKRDADGWITALRAHDPKIIDAIRSALGKRHVTHAELEEALGISLVRVDIPQEAIPAGAAREPARITLQHILISFAGGGTRAMRSRDEAATLAEETLARARQGEDFDALVEALTDAAYPGIYTIANSSVPPRDDEYPRGSVVPAFGDVGFTLAVGEIGISRFSPRSSPHGWHIIKRLQ